MARQWVQTFVANVGYIISAVIQLSGMLIVVLWVERGSRAAATHAASEAASKDETLTFASLNAAAQVEITRLNRRILDLESQNRAQDQRVHQLENILIDSRLGLAPRPAQTDTYERTP